MAPDFAKRWFTLRGREDSFSYGRGFDLGSVHHSVPLSVGETLAKFSDARKSQQVGHVLFTLLARRGQRACLFLALAPCHRTNLPGRRRKARSNPGGVPTGRPTSPR